MVIMMLSTLLAQKGYLSYGRFISLFQGGQKESECFPYTVFQVPLSQNNIYQLAYFGMAHSDHLTNEAFLLEIFINNKQSSRPNEPTNNIYAETEWFLDFFWL